MQSAEVQQLGALSNLFAEVLSRCCPPSVAVLGIAGGNGLDHINSTITKRVVGLDVNASYLEAVRHRYSFIPGLELHCVDLAEQTITLQPVQLVYAALIFEHAGVSRCMENALSLLSPDGTLCVVLQRPSGIEQSVSTTRFDTMQNLRSHFMLIDPAALCEMLHRRKLRLQHQTQRSLPGGKAFWMGIFSGE